MIYSKKATKIEKTAKLLRNQTTLPSCGVSRCGGRFVSRCRFVYNRSMSHRSISWGRCRFANLDCRLSRFCRCRCGFDDNRCSGISWFGVRWGRDISRCWFISWGIGVSGLTGIGHLSGITSVTINSISNSLYPTIR